MTETDVEKLVERLDKLGEFYRYRPVSRDEVPALEAVTRRECEDLFAALDEASRALTSLSARERELEAFVSDVARFPLTTDPWPSPDEDIKIGYIIGKPPYRIAVGDSFILRARALSKKEEGA